MENLNFRKNSRFEYDNMQSYKKRLKRVSAIVADTVQSDDSTVADYRDYRDDYTRAHVYRKFYMGEME
jgi:hypothetical protein